MNFFKQQRYLYWTLEKKDNIRGEEKLESKKKIYIYIFYGNLVPQQQRQMSKCKNMILEDVTHWKETKQTRSQCKKTTITIAHMIRVEET